MGRKNRRHINMMLTPQYCESWGVWECLREVISNAIDADEDFVTEFPTEHSVVITTKTSPTLANLLMPGSGTKTLEDDNRGQFGEGIKIASLVACRLKLGMVIESSIGEITFQIKKAKGFDEESLHAILNTEKVFEGCRISFNAKDIKDIYDNNFLFNTPTGVLPKKDAEKVRVFCKGVHITDLPEKSLWDYNLKNLKLNRDRSLPDNYTLKYEMFTEVSRKCRVDDTAIDLILENQGCFEARLLESRYIEGTLQQRFKDGFERKHGKKAVMSSGDAETDTLAKYKGHNVVDVAAYMSDAMGSVIKADSVLAEKDHYESVDKAQYTDKIKELETIIDICAVGAVSIVVFEAKVTDSGTASLGYYCQGEVGLSETLFMPGNRTKLFSVLIHELAHHLGGSDFSQEFEDNLDGLAGKLAVHLLNCKS